MEEITTIPSLDGAIIHRIAFVDFLQRETTMQFESVSLPGHLLHFVIDGEVKQNVNGHNQQVTAGQVVWYYENEQIKGRIVKAPWKFYTVNFIAPLLSPPLDNQRVIQVGEEVSHEFKELHQVWQNTQLPPTLRHLHLHALLLNLLTKIIPLDILNNRIDSSTYVWWGIEEKIREDLSQPISLNTLKEISHRSIRTIIRSCHLATNTSPMKRLKELRLSYAKGLVLHSQLSITDIAFNVGYSRVQELSRDYHEKFGRTPTQDRKHGPQYRKLESDS